MRVYGIIPFSVIFILLYYGAKFVESTAEKTPSGRNPAISKSQLQDTGSSTDEIKSYDPNSPQSLIDLNLDNRFNTNRIRFVKDDITKTQTFTPTPPFLINTIKKEGKTIWRSDKKTYSFKVVLKSLHNDHSVTKIYFADVETLKNLKPGESLEDAKHQKYSIQFDNDALSQPEVIHIESDSSPESETESKARDRPTSETITLSQSHNESDVDKSRHQPKTSSIVMDLDSDSTKSDSGSKQSDKLKHTEKSVKLDPEPTEEPGRDVYLKTRSVSNARDMRADSESNRKYDFDVQKITPLKFRVRELEMESDSSPESEKMPLSQSPKESDVDKSRHEPKTNSIVLDLDSDSSNKGTETEVDARPKPKAVPIHVDTDTQVEYESDMTPIGSEQARGKVIKVDTDSQKSESGTKRSAKLKHIEKSVKLDPKPTVEPYHDAYLQPRSVTNAREMRVESESNIESDFDVETSKRLNYRVQELELESDFHMDSDVESTSSRVPNPRVREIPLDEDSHAETDIEAEPRPLPKASYQDFELDSDSNQEPDIDLLSKPLSRLNTREFKSEWVSHPISRPIIRRGAKVIRLETDSNHESDIDFIPSRRDKPGAKEMDFESDSHSEPESDFKPSGRPVSGPKTVKFDSNGDDDYIVETRPRPAKSMSDSEPEVEVESRPRPPKSMSDSEPEVETRRKSLKFESDSGPEVIAETRPRSMSFESDRESEFNVESRPKVDKYDSGREPDFKVVSIPRPRARRRSVIFDSGRESDFKPAPRRRSLDVDSGREPDFKVVSIPRPRARRRSVIFDSGRESDFKPAPRAKSVKLESDRDEDSHVESEAKSVKSESDKDQVYVVSRAKPPSDDEGKGGKTIYDEYSDTEPQVFTVPLVILDIDVKENTKAIEYTCDGKKKRELFRAIEPYLIQKVVSRDELLWDSRDKLFSNKVIYKEVDGNPKLKVYLSYGVGTYPVPYRPDYEHFPTHTIPLGQYPSGKEVDQKTPIILDIQMKYCTVLFDYTCYNNVGTYVPKPEYIFTTVKKNAKLFFYGNDVIIWRSFNLNVYSNRVVVFGDDRLIIYLNNGKRVYFKRGADAMWYKLDKSQYHPIDWDPNLVELDVKKKGSTQFYEFFEYQDYFSTLSSRWLYKTRVAFSIKQVQDGSTLIWKANDFNECATSVRVYKSLGGMEHIAIFLKNGSGRSYIKLGFTFGLGGKWVEEAKMFNYDLAFSKKPKKED